jgi:hypothetical protein
MSVRSNENCNQVSTARRPGGAETGSAAAFTGGLIAGGGRTPRR